jgi:hypothetical protein
MLKRLLSISALLMLVAQTTVAGPPSSAVINEFVANHTGSDTNEFVEVYGLPGVSLSTLTILEIEGDGTGAGVVDGVFPVGTTDAAGFWDTGFLNGMIENGTMTLILVENFTGTQGMDLDTDDDGVFDSTPWTAVIDDIGVTDGGASDHTYSAVTLAPFFDGSPYGPGGASRIPNGTDTDAAADWVRNDFDGAGLPGFTGTPGVGEALNTPGAVNELVVPPTDPIINEFVANLTGADTLEYVEILGDPDTDYSNFRILSIEGDGSGAGRVDAIRTPGVTNSDGYWVTNFMSGVLENGSMTLLLVENSTAYIGLDLDIDNDGVLDLIRWSRLVDDVAVMDGGASDHVYASTVLSPGYDGDSYVPGGASRIPDGTDTDSAADWMRNDYDGDGLPGYTGTPESHEALNTPGAMNEEAIDVTPPTIMVDLNRTTLWPPNHKMVDIMATVTVTDNRDPSPTFVLVSIMSSEPDNDLGDGNTVDDIQGYDLGTADVEFQLRSERRGGGNGREYTIVYEATDASGNTAQMTVAVRVPHDQSGMVMASSGFTANGASFVEDNGRFAVVIPSQSTSYATDEDGNAVPVINVFDATQIDAHRVYIGNSRAAIRPEKSSVVDIDQDGRKDLALYFSIEEVRDLQSNLTTGDVQDDYIAVESHDWREFGLIGMQFEAPDGAEMQIANIFELGPPVPITPARNDDRMEEWTSLYPNPFNPATTVAFELAARERVVVHVYDVAGRLVKTLADEAFSSGPHELHWDGSDNHGARVASGIYFIRIAAESYTATRRAVMLK